ncbi:hypothetical protein VHEMI07477 [[Torrubiella] hemipterigena]|uniref:Uncharacterized protein n=1 Tax=[Torrubiella] hemipterigena TaxID=1531966 RepID=A0A0A1TLF6_9HYPO|nr:hypothetical protein VHEMI07477 [[Torrubiella] hemipterigena]
MKFLTLAALAVSVAAQALPGSEVSEIEQTEPIHGRILDGFAIVKRNKCEKAFTGCLKSQVGTHACQCDQGKVIACQPDVTYGYLWHTLKDCPKPKHGGLQCINGKCNN